ncbi:MAG: SRPBCC domain-containing protein [Gemmatimonadaceae bacterium]|nr:SRPBCC domain-containing protein [Gemmatimonadaceae bacterium]
MTVPLYEIDLRVGGRYRLTMRGPDGVDHRVSGVYRVIDPPARLEYTWMWDNEHVDGETIVTIEFLDCGGSTEIVPSRGNSQRRAAEEPRAGVDRHPRALRRRIVTLTT